MPKSARPPSAVAVFMVIKKLAIRQTTRKSCSAAELLPRMVIIPPA